VTTKVCTAQKKSWGLGLCVGVCVVGIDLDLGGSMIINIYGLVLLGYGTSLNPEGFRIHALFYRSDFPKMKRPESECFQALIAS